VLAQAAFGIFFGAIFGLIVLILWGGLAILVFRGWKRLRPRGVFASVLALALVVLGVGFIAAVLRLVLGGSLISWNTLYAWGLMLVLLAVVVVLLASLGQLGELLAEATRPTRVLLVAVVSLVSALWTPLGRSWELAQSVSHGEVPTARFFGALDPWQVHAATVHWKGAAPGDLEQRIDFTCVLVLGESPVVTTIYAATDKAGERRLIRLSPDDAVVEVDPYKDGCDGWK
jgi:hypothetical protein